jgi:hypothetical protein
LTIFTINRVVIPNESKSKYIFSFLARNAIQEILMELKTINRIDTIKKVVGINERLSSFKRFIDRLARTKKTSIVLK